MISETRSPGIINAIRRKFGNPTAGVEYTIPEYFNGALILAHDVPLSVHGQNGALDLAVPVGANFLSLNRINDSVRFSFVDPAIKAGIHLDFETGMINIPAGEEHNPDMLYNLVSAIARMTYYQHNREAVMASSNYINDHLKDYSPEFPIPLSTHPMIRRQQLELWRELCNQEIDITLETLQLINDKGLKTACGLDSIFNYMVTANSSSINRSLLQLPIDPQQVEEETGWSMTIPEQVLQTYQYFR